MAVNPETTVRKLVSLPREFVQEIEDYRFAKRIKTESAAIRALIRAGLDAEKAKPKKK
jgi:Arc/MetJ-type ribon-helix-helix transcriptional regulator